MKIAITLNRTPWTEIVVMGRSPTFLVRNSFGHKYQIQQYGSGNEGSLGEGENAE